MPRCLAALLALPLLLLPACTGDSGGGGRSDGGEDTGGADETGGEETGGAETGSDSGGAGEDTPASDAPGTGDDASGGPDEGGGGDFPFGEPASPPAYSGGSCPVLADGDNDFESGGTAREVRIYLPANPEGASLLFLWHGLGDTASNFASAMGANMVADQEQAIVVVPSVLAGGGMVSMWSFPNALTNAPEEQDLTLFDDLVACVEEQWDIDNRRVYSMGFSAGALWTTFLVEQRSHLLAAAAIFSGGVDEQFTFGYESPEYPTPVLASHGGPDDQYMNMLMFMPATEALVDGLTGDDHVVVLCTHDQGHTVTGPIVDAGYEFLFDADWGTGSMPWADSGLPAAFPSECELQ